MRVRCPCPSHTPILILQLVLLSPIGVTAQVTALDFTGPPNGRLTNEFGNVHDVYPLGDGRVAVLDRVEQDILLADFSADRVTPAARKGSGPSEYRNPGWLAPGPDGGLTTFDMGLQVLHRLGRSGRIVETIPGTRSPVQFAVPFGADSLGGIYYRPIEGLARARGQLTEAEGIPIVRWDTDRNTVDTVARVPPTPLIVQQRGNPGGGMSMTSQTPPLPRITAVAILPEGGVTLIHPEPYRQERAAIHGRLVAGPIIPYESIRVTEADKRTAREAESRSRRGGTGISSTPRPGSGAPLSTRSTSELPWPDTKPPFQQDPLRTALISPQGEVWMLRSNAADDPVPRYDIIDREGRRTAIATLRPNARVVGFGPGMVYVASTDPETGLVHLDRYQR